MPNLWTHILFADEVVEKSVPSFLSSKTERYFRLGAQGPDPFFYHNFWPWKKDKPVNVIGQVIHHNQCGAFLMDMITYGKSHHDEKLRAYILGFVTHHILDRNAHPYIIYRSGDEGSKHTKLETIIDTLMMKRVRGKDTWKNPVHQHIDHGPSLYKPIEEMLGTLIQTFYPNEHSSMPEGYIGSSYSQMIMALKLLFDPYGWKNKLLKNMISSYSHKKIESDVDYLNLKGTEWFHPANGNESSRESFIDLYDKAKKEGEAIVRLIVEYWTSSEVDQEDLMEKVREKIGNRSYDSGKDCTLPLKNQFFDPIL